MKMGFLMMSATLVTLVSASAQAKMVLECSPTRGPSFTLITKKDFNGESPKDFTFLDNRGKSISGMIGSQEGDKFTIRTDWNKFIDFDLKTLSNSKELVASLIVDNGHTSVSAGSYYCSYSNK